MRDSRPRGGSAGLVEVVFGGGWAWFLWRLGVVARQFWIPLGAMSAKSLLFWS
jgi:hypothetical protein